MNHALLAATLFIFCFSLTGCRQPGYRHPSIRRLALYNREGHLEFTVRHRRVDRTPRVGTNNEEDFEETIFEENIELRTDGYVYHPTLLEFSLGALFGLQQADFEQLTGGRRESTTVEGDILEFDVNGTLLQRKPYPTTFYARRSRSVEPRPFRSSIEAISTGYGLTWQLVHAKTPVRVQFNFNEVDLDPFIRAGERKGRRENSTFRAETGYIFNEHNKFLVFYDHESIEEEPFAFQYEVDELRLTHDFEFGNEHQHRLNSQLKYFRQKGTFDNRRLEWLETLSLKHSDRLRTSYEFGVSDRQQGTAFGTESVNERSFRLGATLEHRLYDNLESRFAGYFQNQDFESGLRIRRNGGSADFRYYRHNPWGVLRANYRLQTDQQDVGGGEQAFEVIDMEQTFADPEPIILNDPNIELGSIALLRRDRTELYRPGRDYRLRPLGERVEIERVATGRIQDGETVLISYRFRIGGSYELDTVTQAFGIQQEFDFGVTPYYRFRRQDQSLRPKTSTAITPEDITAHLVGAEYKRGGLRLNGEYEDYDSTVSPFVAVRLAADYSHRFKSGATGSISAHWSDFEYKEPVRRRTRLLTVEGRYRHPVTRRLSVGATVVYRREEDTLSGNDEGVDIDLALEWSIRKTQVRMDYQFATFRDAFAEQGSSALFVQIRRRF